jgi:ABC-type Fe3+-hydroxamate transport system substrate-binding protein
MRAATVGLVAGLTLASCSSPDSRQSATASVTGAPIVDDFGDTLQLRGPAQRVVSLNPVISEAIFALGADARLVGRSRWDAAPAEIIRVPSVGDGIQPNVEAVLAARPDLVVLYAADANRAAAAAFRRAGVQTLTLRTDRVEDFARSLRALGAALGDSVAARTVADSVGASLASVPALSGPKPVSVFWHAWDSPVITIGAGSYLHELITRIGARNVFGDLAAPSPQVTLESVAERNPDYVLAGPQTAPRLRADPRWRTVAAVRAGRVLVFDTTLVGRPGVRMGEAARSLRALIDSAERARP